MSIRKPISHIEKGGRVYLKDNLRSKSRLTREQIEEQVRKAKENKPFRPVEVRPFILDLDRKKYVSKVTNDVLNFVSLSITQGKTPVILLPDTSMRLAGILFHTALSNAFQEHYRNRDLPFVFYINTIHNAYVDIPEVLRQKQDINFMVVDEVNLGNTKKAIESALGNKPIQYLNVNERYFKVGFKVTIVDNGNVYRGIGGVAKKRSGDNTVPERKVLKYYDYVKQNRDQEYWQERDLRKIFFGLGRQLGQRYYARYVTKRGILSRLFG